MTKAINEKDAAQALGVSVRVLQKWRTSGSPIPFMRVASAVRYRVSDIENFMESQLVSSTAEADALLPNGPRRGRASVKREADQ